MSTTIYRAVEDITALGTRDATALADQIIDGVIAALQRDRTIPFRSSANWWLVLSDARLRVAETIATEIAGHVDLGTVLSTIEATFDPIISSGLAADLELADA